MTPKYRIELTLEMDGTSYALRLGTNQLCQIEETTKKSWGDILYHDLNPVHLNLTTLRAIVQIASITPLTTEQAGDLLDVVGFNGLTEEIRNAIAQQLLDTEATTVADLAEAKAAEVAH